MKSAEAIEAFSALSRESRLDVFRLLIRQGAEGMPAGQIADAMGMKANTMSMHLSALTRAELVSAQRDGRSIIYRVNFDAVRGLLAFLMEDCCGGNPDICAPIIDEVTCAC